MNLICKIVVAQVKMPFYIGESINMLVDAILRAPLVSKIAKNPVYTAMSMAVMVVLVVMFIFRYAVTEESLLIMSLRSGFWVFLMFLGVIFVHNKVLTNDYDKEQRTASYESLLTERRADPESVKVSPMLADSADTAHEQEDVPAAKSLIDVDFTQ